VDEFVAQISGGKPFAVFEKEFIEKVRPSSLLKRFARRRGCRPVTYVASPYHPPRTARPCEWTAA